MCGDYGVLMIVFCFLQQVYCLGGTSNNGSDSGDGECRHVLVIFKVIGVMKDGLIGFGLINNH